VDHLRESKKRKTDRELGDINRGKGGLGEKADGCGKFNLEMRSEGGGPAAATAGGLSSLY